MSKAEDTKISKIEDDKGVAEMKLGEYYLHVFIQDVVSIDVGQGEANDVAVQCVAMDKTKTSRHLTDMTIDISAYLGEHMHFVKKYEEREKLESDTLEIKVNKKSTFKLTEEIGAFTINLSSIYYEKNHTIKHKWFLLQNRKESFDKVKGYLKVSINLSFESDKREELITDPDNSNNGIDIPPSINIKSLQMKLRCIKGINLPKMDLIGSPVDAYVECVAGSVKYRTSIVKNLAPHWNYKMFIPIIEKGFIKHLDILCMDYELGRTDERIGCKRIDIKSVDQGEFSNYRWIHMYNDHPPNSSMKVTTANLYRCSILMTIEIQKEFKMPKSGVYERDHTKNPVESIRIAKRDYVVVLDVRSVYTLKSEKNKKHRIRLNCGMNNQWTHFEVDISNIDIQRWNS